MDQAYAAADVIVSRAGAMSIAEICLVAKPAVFVPYPFAAEDHQTVNAMNLVNKKAALLVKDSEAGKQLIKTVVQLAINDEEQKQLVDNIKPLAIGDADIVVAKEVLRLISKNEA